MGYRIGVDVGGTKILILLCREDGAILESRKFASKADKGPRKVMDLICRNLEEILRQQSISWEEVDGLGICVAGFYHMPTGRIISSPNMPGWEGISLTENLGPILHVPLLVENDVNAAAYGEYLFGAGRGKNNILLFTMGTGIGGGLVVNGSIFRGSAGFAGEIGHLPVLPGGPLCGCGRRGCLEALSSGAAIAREGRKLFRENRAGILHEMVKNEEDLEAPHIFKAAEQGDEAALKIIDRAAYYLGLALAAAVNLFNPDVIIAGGGMSQGGHLILTPAESYLRQTAVKPALKEVEIVPAVLGEKAGAWGMLGLLLPTNEKMEGCF